MRGATVLRFIILLLGAIMRAVARHWLQTDDATAMHGPGPTVSVSLIVFMI